MLTIDSVELNSINYTGFSNDMVQLIKETIVATQYLTQKKDRDIGLTIQGSISLRPGYSYYISPAHPGGNMYIQVNKEDDPVYVFALHVFYKKDGTIEYVPHH